MNKTEYLELQRELRPDFKIHHPLIDLLFSLIMAATFLYLISIPAILPYVLSQLLLGLLILRSLFLMHECAHGTAFREPKMNVLLGHIHGLLCFLPFSAWRHTHLKHHAFSGVRGMDPLLIVTNGSGRPKIFRALLSVLWKMGFPFIEFVRAIGYLLSPIMIQRKTKDRVLLIKCICSLALLMGFWGVMISSYPEIVNVQNLLPGVLIYFLMNELISLPQHLDMPSREKEEGSLHVWDHAKVTRSVGIYPFLARHLFLNFNLHTEHHIFPRLPWRQLPAAREALKFHLSESYQEAHWDWSLTSRQKSLGELLELRDFHAT